ncbi:MAG: histidine phosphatase family protein [Rhodospirillales bacterium]|jgi:alpha-ribazole phosphatase|nr:histidine phosphatase family protein [Rhodospirillales bacterium]
MSAVSWWLIRHAPVVGEGRKMINGWNDVAADVTGLAARPRLPARPKAVVVTHLQRTLQTARALGYAPTHTESDLAEQNFGAWQGKTWAEITGPESHAFWADFAHAVPPGGESFVQQIGRVEAALERLSQSFGSGEVVAVVHGGTIRAALCHALDLSPLKAQAFVVDNVHLTRLDRTRHGWRVGCVNERLF